MSYKLYKGKPSVETHTYTPEPVTRVSISNRGDEVHATFCGDSLLIEMDVDDTSVQLYNMHKGTAIALADAILKHFGEE